VRRAPGRQTGGALAALLLPGLLALPPRAWLPNPPATRLGAAAMAAVRQGAGGGWPTHRAWAQVGAPGAALPPRCTPSLTVGFWRPLTSLPPPLKLLRLLFVPMPCWLVCAVPVQYVNLDAVLPRCAAAPGTAAGAAAERTRLKALGLDVQQLSGAAPDAVEAGGDALKVLILQLQ
jgi:hypothetical protein